MISEKSLHKLILINIKKRMYLGVLALIVFMLCYPVRILFAIQNASSTFYLSGLTILAEDLSDGLKRLMTTPDTAAVIFLAFFAFLISITGFKYLHNSGSEDFYHSLAMKRTALFRIKYVSGLLLLIIPFTISYITGALVIIGATEITFSAAPAMLLNMLFHILSFMAVYSCVIFSLVISGRTFIGAVTSLVLMLILPGSKLLYYNVLESCFSHMVLPSSRNIWSQLTIFSPLSSILYKRGSLTGFLVTLAYALFFTLFAVLLYRKRPSECAGEAYAWKNIKYIVKFLVLVPSSTLMGYVIYSLTSLASRTISIAWFAGTAVACVFVFGFIMDIIFNLGISGIKKSLIPSFFALAADIFLLVMIFVDPFHMDAYIPDKNDLIACGLSSDFDYIFQGSLLYPSADMDKRAFINRTENVDPILDILEDSVENNYVFNPETDYEYLTGISDTELDLKGTTIKTTACYYMKDNRKVYRTFYVDSEKYAQLLRDLTRDKAYREQTYMFNEDSFSNCNEIQLSDYQYTSERFASIPLIGNDLKTFAACLTEDARNMSYSDFESSSPLYMGVLSGMDDENPKATGADKSLLADTVYIYPEYKNTLEFLAAKGFSPADIAIPLKDIVYISYNSGDDSPYYINDFDYFYPFMTSVKRTTYGALTSKDGIYVEVCLNDGTFVGEYYRISNPEQFKYVTDHAIDITAGPYKPENR